MFLLYSYKEMSFILKLGQRIQQCKFLTLNFHRCVSLVYHETENLCKYSQLLPAHSVLSSINLSLELLFEQRNLIGARDFRNCLTCHVNTTFSDTCICLLAKTCSDSLYLLPW